MWRRLTHFLLLVVASACFGCREGTPSESAKQAVEQLRTAKTFSLGPVGAAGSVPEEERTFLVIVTSPGASQVLSDLYERGTPAAKVYALCGLRHTSARTFRKYEAKFVAENLTVETLSSCYGSARTAQEILAAFNKDVLGDYLKFLKHEDEIKRSK